MNNKLKKYVEFKVYSVIQIKGKYGYRIRLIYTDGNVDIQQKSGFENRKIAEKEREKTITELHNGTYITDEKLKVDKFLLQWLENEMRLKVTDDSYVAYKNAITKHIIPKIGNLTLTSLNRGHIQKLYDEEAKISISVLKIIKPILNTSLNYALNKKLIDNNPANDVELPKGIKHTQYRVREIDIKKTLTLEQVKVLVEASKNTKIHLQILFAVLMGLRRGEINGLKYSDIDYTRRTIKIDRQLGIVPNTVKDGFAPKTYTKQEIKLKTKSSYRELDLPDYIFEAILEQRKEYERVKKRWKNYFQDEDYICCSMYGRPRSKNYNWKHFKKLLKENNLPDIRWHDLRATYSTLLMKNDFNIKAIAKLLGHAKEIITADIYGDTKEIIEDCVEDIERFIKRVEPAEENKAIDLIEELDIDKISMNYLKE